MMCFSVGLERKVMMAQDGSETHPKDPKKKNNHNDNNNNREAEMIGMMSVFEELRAACHLPVHSIMELHEAFLPSSKEAGIRAQFDGTSRSEEV
eukprot:TCALIF_04621-PA protein Name:"Protein of unknown function" AED:0.63 eAED:1.00 QI:0/0/0/0.5/1/1/2/0/93